MSGSVLALNSLAERCGLKRSALVKAGMRGSKWRKRLHVTSGVLALLSAASITAIIAAITDAMTVKVISALLALTSGTISLVVSSYFDDKEIAKLHEGAAQFLALRDQAILETNRPGGTDKQAFAALQKLQEEYAKRSKEYDHLIGSVDHSEYMAR